MNTIDQSSLGFEYITNIFPEISKEIVKAAIFNDTQMRQFINDPQFTEVLIEIKCNGRLFVESKMIVVKSENYKPIEKDTFNRFQIWGSIMSSQVHYLFSDLDRFLANFGNFSEQQANNFTGQQNYG